MSLRKEFATADEVFDLERLELEECKWKMRFLIAFDQLFLCIKFYYIQNIPIMIYQ